VEKLISTLLGVVVALGASGLLFVGANRWFDQVRREGRGFGVVTGAILGLGLSIILVGNRIFAWKPGPDTDLTLWLVPLAGVAGAAYGALLASARSRVARLVAGAGGGLILGLLAAIFVKPSAFPAMRIGPLLLWPAGAGLLGLIIGIWRRRPPLLGVVSWATAGWLVGAFGVPALGVGTRAEAMLGTGLLGLGLGVRLGLQPSPTHDRREEVYNRSRAVIFLAPALGFIAVALLIPTVRTILLSFLDRRGREAVGWSNYKTIFTDPNMFNLSKWAGILASRLFLFGVGLILLGVVLGLILGRRTGRSMELNGVSMTPLAIGVFLGAFGVFSILRGTVINNLWWVFTVTLLAAATGLAIAVLADRSRFESVAKSIIFLPMAISFVGAGIIWRFMYIARPPQKDQTGVLNALWVGLGKLSNSGLPRAIVVAVLVAAALGLGVLAYRASRSGANGIVGGSVLVGLPVLWVIYRLLGPGLGGFEVGPTGDVVGKTIIFTNEAPFNNFWLMVVLIWIQVGFTMVIFSAAIKAVPAELIEASKVDGATESQTFWRVTVPQIAPTIGVVVTTLIVLVMKVFDIVKVMTNGNFGTDVIANQMWTRGFSEFNIGLGAALAVVLFVSVLPVMYINIRRMQREAH
jgi:alpha-glucoside transport system permease protein